MPGDIPKRLEVGGQGMVWDRPPRSQVGASARAGEGAEEREGMGEKSAGKG